MSSATTSAPPPERVRKSVRLRQVLSTLVLAAGLIGAATALATPVSRSHAIPRDLTDRKAVPRVQLDSKPAPDSPAAVAIRPRAASRTPADSVRAALIGLGKSVKTWKQVSVAALGLCALVFAATGMVAVLSRRRVRAQRTALTRERARRLREASAREVAESEVAQAVARAREAENRVALAEQKVEAASTVASRQAEARSRAEREAAQALESAGREIAAREAAERTSALARLSAEREHAQRGDYLESVLIPSPSPRLVDDIELAVDEAWSRALRPHPQRPTHKARRRPVRATSRGSRPRAAGADRSAVTRHEDLLRRSQRAERAGRSELALDLAQRANRARRSRASVLQITRLLAVAGRFEAADGDRLRRALQVNPEEPTLLMATGVYESLHGNPHNARVLLEAALHRESDSHRREQILRAWRSASLRSAARA